MADKATLTLRNVKVRQIRDGTAEVRFVTNDGGNKGILHHREGYHAAVVLVGGAGGGFDGPASIYPDLAEVLESEGVSSLRLDYRRPNDLEACVLDVLVAIQFLGDQGIEEVGLVGWSFGGAVVIGAGANSDLVTAVVTVATQSHGTALAPRLSPKALLLIHGAADRTLPPSCSQEVYEHAGEPKELVIYQGANHGIDQKREPMLRKIEDFLVGHLGER